MSGSIATPWPVGTFKGATAAELAVSKSGSLRNVQFSKGCRKLAAHMASLLVPLFARAHQRQVTRSMVHLIRGTPHAGDAPKTDRSVLHVHSLLACDLLT